jgi:CarD family transcriptional regulator
MILFKTGDLVVYGAKGVCRVLEICRLPALSSDPEREFYKLEPLFIRGSVIYTPVDSEKVVMRRVISKDTAIRLIDDIPNIDIIKINDDKKREAALHDSVNKCDCRELVKVIKTLYQRKKSREAAGKKQTSVDEKYLNMAENNLYSELSIPLEISKDKIEDYITERINAIKSGEQLAAEAE